MKNVQNKNPHRKAALVGLVIVVLLCASTIINAQENNCPFQASQYGRGEVYDSINTIRGDGLGWTLEQVGDIDGDGANDYATTRRSDIKRNYLKYQVSYYSGKTNSYIQTLTSNSHSEITFGQNLGEVGDLNNDGLSESFISNHLDLYSEDKPGLIYVMSPYNAELLYTLSSGESHKDKFGTSVVATGDMNGDSISEILVGAPNAFGLLGCTEDTCAKEGAFYLFDGKTGNRLYVFTNARSEGAIEISSFAEKVSALGDINLDSIPDVAIFDAAEDTITALSGKSLIKGEIDILFSLTENENETINGKLTPLGDINNDRKANFIAQSEIYSEEKQDFYNTLYVLSYSQSGELVLHYALSGKSFDLFGNAITSVSDLNSDGVKDLAISSPHAEWKENRGRVEIFSGADGSKLQTIYAPQNGRSFGYDIAYVGDANNDGFGELIISDPKDQSGMDYTNYKIPNNYNSTFSDVGAVHSISLSLDNNRNGILDGCEPKPSATPVLPTDPTDPGNPSNPGNPSSPNNPNNDGTDGSISNPNTPGTASTQTAEELINAILNNIHFASKRGKKNRKLRSAARKKITTNLNNLFSLSEYQTQYYKSRARVLRKKFKRAKKVRNKKRQKRLWRVFSTQVYTLNS